MHINARVQPCSARAPYAGSPRCAPTFAVNHLHAQTIGSGATITLAHADDGPMNNDIVSSGTGTSDNVTVGQYTERSAQTGGRMHMPYSEYHTHANIRVAQANLTHAIGHAIHHIYAI